MTDQLEQTGYSPVKAQGYPGDGGVVKVGDNTQLVDLDVTYEETGGSTVSEAVSGIEQYGKGMLSPAVGRALKLQGVASWDPMTSRRNAVVGGENFVLKLRDGFITFIKWIIDFVKKGVDWLLTRIKTFLGFRKTEERIRASEAMAENLKKEIIVKFEKLGAPPGRYSLDSLFESMPAGMDRLETIKYLRTRINGADETAMVEKLSELYPLIQPVVKQINRDVSEMNRLGKQVSREIGDMRRTAKRNALASTDVQRFFIACNDVKVKAVDFEGLFKQLTNLASVFYGVNLEQGVAGQVGKALRDTLNSHREVVSQNLNPQAVRNLYASTSALNKKIAEGNTSHIDMSNLDLGPVKDLISLSDAEFLKELSQAINNDTPSNIYLTMGDAVRQYVNYADSAVLILNDIAREIDNYARWHAQADAMLAVYATNDLVQIKEYMDQVKASGVNLYQDHNGKPLKMVVLADAPSDSMIDAFRQAFQEGYKLDINGIRTAANNFARSVGLHIKVG